MEMRIIRFLMVWFSQQAIANSETTIYIHVPFPVDLFQQNLRTQGSRQYVISGEFIQSTKTVTMIYISSRFVQWREWQLVNIIQTSITDYFNEQSLTTWGQQPTVSVDSFSQHIHSQETRESLAYCNQNIYPVEGHSQLKEENSESMCCLSYKIMRISSAKAQSHTSTVMQVSSFDKLWHHKIAISVQKIVFLAAFFSGAISM